MLLLLLSLLFVDSHPVDSCRMVEAHVLLVVGIYHTVNETIQYHQTTNQVRGDFSLFLMQCSNLGRGRLCKSQRAVLRAGLDNQNFFAF